MKFSSRIKSSGNKLFSLCLAAFVIAVLVELLFSRPTVPVEVSVFSDNDFTLQFYYTESKTEPFSEQHSISKIVKSGQRKVTIHLPASQLANIRVDFGINPGHLILSPLHLHKRKDSIVLNWDNFIPSPDIESFSIDKEGSLDVLSEKIDPFFAYAKELDVPGASYHGMLYHFSRIALRTMVLCALMALILLLKILLWVELRGISLDYSACRAVFAELFSDICSHKAFAIYMLVVIMLGWGFELANFTMTLDDEIILFSPAKQYWITQGRWTMCILDFLIGNVSVPMVPLAITLFFYALSFCVIFNRQRRFMYLLFPIYIAFPTLFHSLSYSALNPGVGLGFLLMALAARLVFTKGAASFIVGVFLGTLAIGSYQVFLVYGAIAILALWLQMTLDDDEMLSWSSIAHYAVRSFAMLLGSALLYKIVQIGFKHAFAIASDNYIVGFIGKIDSLEKAKIWTGLITHKIKMYLFGMEPLYPLHVFALGALTVASFVFLLAWLVVSRQKRKAKIAIAFVYILVTVLPFSPDVLNCQATIPCRVITIMLPIAVTATTAVALRFAERIRFCRIAFFAIVAYATIQFLWALNQESFASLLRARRDASFAMEIKTRIDALPEAVEMEISDQRIPLVLVGCLPRDFRTQNGISWPSTGNWPEWQSEMIGVSLFSLPFRFDWGLRLHTGDVFFCVPLQGASPAFEAFVENMPAWPLNGSVAFFEGKVVVKFTDYLPKDRAFFDGPATRHCRDKKEIKTPVNGFDELLHTVPVDDCLLYAFSDLDVRFPDDSAILPERNPFSLSSENSRLFLKAVKTDEPYVILEFSLSFEKGGVIGLWGDIPRQCARYGFDKGDHMFRLRVPSHFLNGETRLDFGYGSNNRAVINSLKVYADKAYTEHLFELNPGMRESLMRKQEEN